MRYNTEKQNDGSLKVVVEFGVTDEQSKLQTAFLTFLESLIYMQKIMIQKDIEDTMNSMNPEKPNIKFSTKNKSDDGVQPLPDFNIPSAFPDNDKMIPSDLDDDEI